MTRSNVEKEKDLTKSTTLKFFQFSGTLVSFQINNILALTFTQSLCLVLFRIAETQQCYGYKETALLKSFYFWVLQTYFTKITNKVGHGYDQRHLYKIRAGEF